MIRTTVLAAAAALILAATAAAGYKPYWHHAGLGCNDNPAVYREAADAADAGPFATLADCKAYVAPAATAAVVPQPPDSYLWCNSQTETAPFSLSLAESLTLTANWYRPLMVDGAPTCATAGLHPAGVYLDSNGNGPSNQAQYDADVAYWGVASLYATATR